MSRWTSIASRVVPGMGETIAASRRASALSSVDLPALGGPAITTVTPSRTISPLAPVPDAAARSALTEASNAASRSCAKRRDIALIGKVDLGFEQRRGFEKRRAPSFRLMPQVAARLPQGLTALLFRLGVDQIGDAFDFGEVEFAVLEGATGKFARLRRARRREMRQRGQHARR